MDNPGKKGTLTAIRNIRKSMPDIDIFVTQLPEGIKDPDQLIMKSGIDSFKDCLRKSKHDYDHQLELIDTNDLTPKKIGGYKGYNSRP